MTTYMPKRILQWMPYFQAALTCYGVDPLTLAAIMEVETQGGESPLMRPRGPGGRGDKGHGHGLMQIDDRSHAPFIAATFDDGVPLWKDPAFNILYAAKLFARNLDYFDGYEPAAIASYNCGPGNAKKALASVAPTASEAQRIAALDMRTAHQNYVTKVLTYRRMFAGFTITTRKESGNGNHS